MKATFVILVVGMVTLATGIFGNLYNQVEQSESIQHMLVEEVKPFNSSVNRGHMTYDSDNTYSNGVKEDIETIKSEVEKYISRFSQNLSISAIFIYEDSDYYFSIVDNETHLGVMELLVNSVTLEIHPEFVPNMMWNTEYGMHGGGHGMMFNNNGYYDSNETELSVEDVIKFGEEYFKDTEYKLTDDYHKFNGYYTFHLEVDGEVSAMASIHAFTGEVWFHDWHGKLIEVIETHDE